jgi:hypothetical protein
MHSGDRLFLQQSPVFVYETLPVGQTVPTAVVCAVDTGSSLRESGVTSPQFTSAIQPIRRQVQQSQSQQRRLDIIDGDASGYFLPTPVNDSCWTLLLRRPLEADVSHSRFFPNLFLSNLI